MSNMRKYVPNPEHIIEYKPIHIRSDLSFPEEPIRLLERQERQLGTKTIPYVKVLWKHHKVTEATWEPEHEMQEKYPNLFEAGM